jgi:hypothetical protein
VKPDPDTVVEPVMTSPGSQAPPKKTVLIEAAPRAAPSEPSASTPKTIMMDAAAVGGRGVHLEGPLSPAAVLTLGARVAERMDPLAFAPAGIVVERDGSVSLQPATLEARYVAPEGPGPTAVGAVWALGRFLLEMSLGHAVPDEQMATLTHETLWSLVDLEGRPLAPRQVDVLWAMIVQDPASRLQSVRAVARVCADASATFGKGGPAALRAAVTAQTNQPLRSTKEMPAKAILDANDLRRLRVAAPTLRITWPPWAGSPLRNTNPPSLGPKDVAARLVEAAGGADSDTLNDNEVEALQQVERQRTRMLLGFGAAAVVAVVLGLIVAMR